MSNGASRIFNVMKNSGTDTISEVVYLIVYSINPLVFHLEDRLDIENIDSNFYILSDNIIKERLEVGDKVIAFTFNDGQKYFITQGLTKNLKRQTIDNLTSESAIDNLSANQGRILKNNINAIQTDLGNYKTTVSNRFDAVDTTIGNTNTNVDNLQKNLEAVRQAAFHILMVERYSCLIYDDNYGVELEQYIGQPFEFLEVTIEDTLKEALTQDERIIDVIVNNIEKIDGDKAHVDFTVVGIYGNIQMEVEINV